MRAIEFRGLGYNNKWLYGHYSDETDGHSDFPCIIPFRNTESPSCWIVDKNTVGQYTGLKDKNGIKIYEGDIVKNTIGKLEKVVFVNGSFQCASIESPNRNLYLLDTYHSYIEVIGNIHEESENNDIL